jgi:hypothetical protein
MPFALKICACSTWCANCHACGHKAIVPNASLLQGRQGYMRLMSLERQLRCRKCGERGKASLDVEFRPRD